MEATAVLPKTNGILPNDTAIAEISHYEKILSLHDAILAGSHPRLKLTRPSPRPAAARGEQTDVSSQVAPTALKTQPSPTPRAHNIVQAPVTSRPPEDVEVSRSQPYFIQPFPQLDPIFREKSDELVRAEIELERKKIERSIEDQLQNKRVLQKKNLEQDRLPDIDVSEVFAQAQEIVKHVSSNVPAPANRVVSSSDSLSEKDFYSSQVNESTSDEAEERPKLRATKPCRFFFEGSCKKGDSCTFSHDPAFKQQLQTRRHLPAEVEGLETETNTRARRPNSRNEDELRNGRARNLNRESGELIEESPYSPTLQINVEESQPQRSKPNGHAERVRQQDRQQDDMLSPFRPSGRNPDPRHHGHIHGTLGSRDGQVVRNHITSPFAPQPARVSPLAMSKFPRVEHVRRDAADYQSPGARQSTGGLKSPAVGPAPISRKRRRELDAGETSRNIATRRYIGSPAPYIKNEPASPPRFQDIPSHQYAFQETHVRAPSPRQDERVIYETVQPAARYAEDAHARRVPSPSVRRVFSGPNNRPEFQREPSLRRVLSARHAERPLSPDTDLEYYAQPPMSSRPARAVPQQPIQGEGTISPYAGSHRSSPAPMPQKIQGLPPEPRRMPYSAIDQQQVMMAPPPRRIVVDQHGNRYYDTGPQIERRPSLAPEVRYANETASSLEQPNRRGTVRPETARVYEDNFAHPTPRREMTPPHHVQYRTVDRPEYREIMNQGGEFGYRDRTNLVRVVEYPRERYQPLYEEMRPRDSPIRMQSVRPVENHYEVPRERLSRIQSVRPEQHRMIELDRDVHQYGREIREVSVRADERYGRPEYVEPVRPRLEYVSKGQLPPDYNPRIEGQYLVGEEPLGQFRRPVQR